MEANESDKIFAFFCDEVIFYNCAKLDEVKSDVSGWHGIAHCWYDTYPNRKNIPTKILSSNPFRFTTNFTTNR